MARPGALTAARRGAAELLKSAGSTICACSSLRRAHAGATDARIARTRAGQVLCLVAAKCDRPPRIARERAVEYADQMGALFFETSAKNNTGTARVTAVCLTPGRRLRLPPQASRRCSWAWRGI